jgi:hypothetical protein
MSKNINNTAAATSNEEQTVAPIVHTKESIMAASNNIKSVAIRTLLAQGMKRGEVAKLLEIRYQHVRNVEITPIKKV